MLLSDGIVAVRAVDHRALLTDHGGIMGTQQADNGIVPIAARLQDVIVGRSRPCRSPNRIGMVMLRYGL